MKTTKHQHWNEMLWSMFMWHHHNISPQHSTIHGKWVQSSNELKKSFPFLISVCILQLNCITIDTALMISHEAFYWHFLNGYKKSDKPCSSRIALSLYIFRWLSENTWVLNNLPHRVHVLPSFSVFRLILGPQRTKIIHIFVIGLLRFCHMEDPLTFGVWKDPTTC